MEAVVLRRIGFLAYSCPKQSQDFKPSAAPLHPNMAQVRPSPGCLGRASLLYVPAFVADKVHLRVSC